jgi:hypothetical protein
MPIVRAAVVLVCAATAAALSACATRVSTDAPAGVTLQGAWKLDHAASDDPEKILAKMRTEAFKLLGRRTVVTEPRQGRRGARAGEATQETAGDEEFAPDAHGHRPDPLRRSPMAHIIMTTVARGDFLTVRQKPGEIVLDYGTSQRTFAPGLRSVVSAEGGVGDQTSGWKGHEYVIQLRAQMGPDVTERYGLSPDGKHLIEKLHIGSAELPAVELTRVYNPTSEAAPRQFPIND